MTTYEGSFSFYNVGVKVISNSSGPLDRIRGFFKYFHSEIPSSSAIAIYHILDSGSNKLLLENDKKIFETESLHDLILMTELTIFNFAVKRLNYLVLHAAALSKNGEGILFPGLPKIGKTTLTIALVRKGYCYLSDDIALVDKTLKILPFPKAMSLRMETLNLFDDLRGKIDENEYFIEPSNVKKWFVNLQDLYPNSLGDPCQVKYIIFPSIDLSKKPMITKISKGEAMIDLMKASFNIKDKFDISMDVYGKLVENTEGCYRLSVSDLDKTIDLINTALDS